MIEKRTVFILGAGASHPYGLPTGNGLRLDIIEKFRKSYGDHLVIRRETEEETTRRGYPTISDAVAFLSAFDGPNTMESIDLFLSRQPRFRTIGKLAILLSILRHEREGRFGHRTKKPELDWYSLLYDRMTRELIGKDDYKGFARNKVAFITFNYDRSLERFLFQSLRSFEDATPEKVREQINQITINHIYGKLAPLPWQDSDASKTLDYGVDDAKSYGKLPDMIENLYVVHEERVNPELEKARVTISEAERIFFLGFGYAKENLVALGLPDVLTPEHYIYGTTKGWIDRKRENIERRFLTELGNRRVNTPENRVFICDCDCLRLLEEFL